MLYPFLNGAVFMATIVIALFFWRFWRRTRDRLFLYFTAAFCLLTIDRILIAVFLTRPDFNPYVYSVRLLAYVLIIAGVIGKNRAK
jgi:hypothetical protein